MWIVPVSASFALCGDVLCEDDWCGNSTHGNSTRIGILVDRRQPVAWFKTKKARIVDSAELTVPESLPVHQHEIIAHLGTELPSYADALRYRDHYARLLPTRIESLTKALRSGDEGSALGVLMSLHIGAHMVGAPRLEFVADQCLTDIRAGQRSCYMPALVREAERFLRFLTEEQRASN